MNHYLKKWSLASMAILFVCFLFSCHKDTPAYFYNLPDTTSNQNPPDNPDDNPSDTSITDSEDGIDTSGYAEARNFPGMVGKEVERVDGYQFTLDLNYADVSGSMKVVSTPAPIYSSGLYAPAGERIIIDVPAGVSGLKVQIGAWTDDLSGEAQQDRVPVIYTKEDLEPGTDTVGSLYGGPIYIVAPGPIAQTVTFTVTGAVKAPDFVLGKTTPAQWWTEVQTTEVPWLELRSENMVMTVPRDEVIQAGLNDPTNLLTFWNEAVQKDFYNWTGLEENPSKTVDQAPTLPFRVVFDKQILGDEIAHAGSPVMVKMNAVTFPALTNIGNLTPDQTALVYNIFGQNEIQPAVWTWDGVKDAAIQIFGVHAAHRLGMDLSDLNPDMADALEAALAYSGDMNSAKDFKEASHSADFKLIPFVQIFEKAQPAQGNGTDGYDFVPFLYKHARRLSDLPASNQDKRDLFYETLSDFLGKDATPFFQAWGINISQDAKDKVAGEGFDTMDKTLWTYDPVQDTGYNDYAPTAGNPYNNLNWEVIDVSSEKTGNEGAKVIDGNKSTFWQDNTGGQVPFTITVDMKQALEVGSFYFIQNQNDKDTRARFIQLETSTNGTDWTYATTFFLKESKDTLTFNLDSKKTFQYFKLTIPDRESIYNSTDASLAEVGLNQEPDSDIPGYTATNPGHPYDKANWTIFGYDSQQETNEGAAHGFAKNIIDGDINTYWHDKYSGGTYAPPHFVIVDMHNKNDVYGIEFTQRQHGSGSSRNIKKLTIKVSDDLQHWKELGPFSLEEKDAPQNIWFNSKQNFRYMMLETKSTADVFDGTNFISIAEVDVKKNPKPADPYNPANWSITASNEQAEGVAADAIDGDANTFWTAQWNPHTNGPWKLTVNMNQSVPVATFYVMLRKGNNRINTRPGKIKIEVSNDGTSWTDLGMHDLDVHTADTQAVSINKQSFQYFRFTIDKSNVGDATHAGVEPSIAEVWVSKDKYVDPDYQPSNWSVIDFNSKAPYEPGASGVPEAVIDGDPSTYWHSNWKGTADDGAGTPPYHLTLDLGKELPVDSFYLVQRPGTNNNWNTRIKTLNISVTNDLNGTWTDLKVFTGLSTADADPMPRIVLKLDQTRHFRYFKITINGADIGSGDDVGLAEIGVYK